MVVLGRDPLLRFRWVSSAPLGDIDRDARRPALVLKRSK